MPDQQGRLTHQEVKACVIEALKAIASFSGNDVEQFVFTRFKALHKKYFNQGLKLAVRKIRTNALICYDIDLGSDPYQHWPNVGECITWVCSHSGPGPDAALTKNDLENA